MLKNGTLLKVNPELIQALKNALDLRYLPLIQQARRQHRALALSDDVEAPSTEYNGYFKVIWDNVVDEAGNVTQRRVKVIDGANPESGMAGNSDIGQIPVGYANVPDSGRNILYLLAKYDDETQKYTTYFEVFQGSKFDGVMWQEIASLDDNFRIINQRWTSGTVYFGSRFWL